MNDPLLKIIEDVAFIRAKVEGIEKQNESQFTLLFNHQKDINGLMLREANLNGKITIVTVIVGAAMTVVISVATKIWRFIIN